MTGPTERAQLVNGAAALECTLEVAQVDRLLAYLHLLQKWNRTYNLIGPAEVDEIIARHLLDSLSVARWVEGSSVLDLGSGAGLPGIPLAIAQPGRAFTLLDGRQKRTAFLEQVRISLQLANVAVVNGRAEPLPAATFDTVVVRAFGTLSTICQAAGHLLARQGIIVAMKGELDEQERGNLPAEFVLKEELAVQVPGVRGARSVAIVMRQG